MAERDEKGRFAEGNNIGVEHRFQAGGQQADIARKGGTTSQEVQKQRKTLAERLAILDTQLIQNSKGEKAERADVIALQLSNKAASGDLKAIRLKAEIQGELRSTVDLNVNDEPLILTKVYDE